MFGFIPTVENSSVFYYTDSATTFYAWSKPSGVSFINFLLLGSGGNGGDGARTAAGTARGGGGGGGSGSITSVTYPAKFLPDKVYFSMLYGQTTYVLAEPSTSLQYILALANEGNNGGSTTTTTAGTAGAGGTIVTLADMPLGSFGSCAFRAGVAGRAGGSGTSTTGGSIDYDANGGPIAIITGGAGGAGVTSGNLRGTGGSVTGVYPLPIVSGGAAAVAGRAGEWNQRLLCGTGGSGAGGSTATGTLAGGSAINAFGCGGGGGGAGVTSLTGTGGPGGPGLIVATYW